MNAAAAAATSAAAEPVGKADSDSAEQRTGRPRECLGDLIGPRGLRYQHRNWMMSAGAITTPAKTDQKANGQGAHGSARTMRLAPMNASIKANF